MEGKTANAENQAISINCIMPIKTEEQLELPKENTIGTIENLEQYLEENYLELPCESYDIGDNGDRVNSKGEVLSKANMKELNARLEKVVKTKQVESEER